MEAKASTVELTQQLKQYKADFAEKFGEGAADQAAVLCSGAINGQKKVGKNKRIRALEGSTDDQKLLIHERVKADEAAERKAYFEKYKTEEGFDGKPNLSMADAHAELDVMQQWHNELSHELIGKDMTLSVVGEPICHHCRKAIRQMAEEMKLRSLTIYEANTGNILFWEMSHPEILRTAYAAK